MELAMARRFDEMSLDEMTSVNGGEIYKDADDANLAAFVFAVGAIVAGGPLAKVYGEWQHMHIMKLRLEIMKSQHSLFLEMEYRMMVGYTLVGVYVINLF